jgi:hypothetical protein
MVPRGENHYQYIEGERQKKKRSVDNRQQENADAA